MHSSLRRTHGRGRCYRAVSSCGGMEEASSWAPQMAGSPTTRASVGHVAVTLRLPSSAGKESEGVVSVWRVKAPSGSATMPGAPSSPAAPGSPEGPASPFAPAGPGSPFAPSSPLAPAGPGSPLAPAGPTGPVRPRGPVGPVGPATEGQLQARGGRRCICVGVLSSQPLPRNCHSQSAVQASAPQTARLRPGGARQGGAGRTTKSSPPAHVLELVVVVVLTLALAARHNHIVRRACRRSDGRAWQTAVDEGVALGLARAGGTGGAGAEARRREPPTPVPAAHLRRRTTPAASPVSPGARPMPWPWWRAF